MSWRLDEKTGINYTNKLIKNNEFYLSPATNFNDPFDSAIYIDLTCPKKTSLKIMYEEAKKRLGRYNLFRDEKKLLKKLVTKKPLGQIKKSFQKK